MSNPYEFLKEATKFTPYLHRKEWKDYERMNRKANFVYKCKMRFEREMRVGVLNLCNNHICNHAREVTLEKVNNDSSHQRC